MNEPVTEQAFLEQLQSEKSRLENAVVQLERTINECKEAIATEGDADGEYRSAIGENIVVIAKYKARIARIEVEITDLSKGIQDLGNQVALPVTEQPPAAPGAAQREEDAVMEEAAAQQSEQLDTSGNNEGMYL